MEIDIREWNIIHVFNESTMLFFLFPPIQQALRVCSRESGRRKQPQIYSATVESIYLEISATKSTNPGLLRIFHWEKSRSGSSRAFPSTSFWRSAVPTQTHAGSRYKIRLWIKPLHSPMSEFIEVSRETVGRKIRSRIIIFQSHWMSFFPSVGWKSEVLKEKRKEVIVENKPTEVSSEVIPRNTIYTLFKWVPAKKQAQNREKGLDWVTFCTTRTKRHLHKFSLLWSWALKCESNDQAKFIIFVAARARRNSRICHTREWKIATKKF